ncbi:PDZ domain-containing protein [Rhodococcoides trifolii]|uniref:endopeptidase La n=1 Tax=Rhodococcoides trifolii TaxID=908250 RepID=A0A917D6J3_9NOCA|nr:PDZ domain-containing protein [Rhodococcus trifolii]
MLGVLGTVVTVPFAALGPGPTFNTLAEVDGKQVVDIEGTPVDPTSGNLNMTTVAVRDGLNVFEALGLWLSGRQGLVPREEVYPPEKTEQEIQDANQADFQQSENSAELAALHFLDLPVDLRIKDVSDDGPAANALRDGDTLVSIDGKPVTTVSGVQDVVGDIAPDTSITLDILRDGAPVSETVTVGARPGDTGRGYLGVTPEEVPNVPFDVTFNLADIGGPSAGLMFTLAVIDKLSPGELSGGRFVAGTGTIASDGTVGPIGGIPYKLIAAREAGATTFLVPSENCDEAKAHAQDGLQLVKVDSLGSAVDSLTSLRSGGDAPSC